MMPLVLLVVVLLVAVALELAVPPQATPAHLLVLAVVLLVAVVVQLAAGSSGAAGVQQSSELMSRCRPPKEAATRSRFPGHLQV